MREFSGDAFENAARMAIQPLKCWRETFFWRLTYRGEVVPTMAGLLLFGRDDRVAALLPRSEITATRFAGDTIHSPVVERIRITGNLLSLYEASHRFIKRYADLWDTKPRSFPAADLSDSPVAARGNYQRGAVNEALSNLLIHRDLGLRDQSTRLQVFDHSIELINPRRTLRVFSSSAKGDSLRPAAAAEFASGRSLLKSGLWGGNFAGWFADAVA